jgi:hypothetical protein
VAKTRSAGMSWIPDGAWMTVAESTRDSEGELLEGVPAARGAVGLVFQNDRDTKVWIIMLMQLQRLAWEIYLMDTSGAQLVDAISKLFWQATPTTQAGIEQAPGFASLRALHALFLPARGSTLSVGLKSYPKIADSTVQSCEFPL